MKISVIGAGGWGTAFARLLARRGHEAVLWARAPGRALELDRLRENRAYLPGVLLPQDGLRITSSLEEALAPQTVCWAVPSFALPEVLRAASPFLHERKTFINLAKGLDPETGGTLSSRIAADVPARAVFALSGPCHAEEVGRDMPTAVVLAGTDAEIGRTLQIDLSTPRFRVYLSDDLRGVELCAAVKNVIALATGASDGLGYGDNSRGALITRGLAEMTRFGRALGGNERTFYGLAGVGDLVTTCTSEHSRNRAVGLRLGRGEPLAEILAGMHMVAEGVYATRLVDRLAEERGIDMPITRAVLRLLDATAEPLSLVEEIMTRAPKREGD